MDSRSRLDYALFQLTPTRTRCDLVICSGDCKEKLASGLLEPFITHLEFAKYQISKGGYSITLSASASASWFTKSTIERFVKFVSTPEVLERFITIEREITNIDCSINTNLSSDSQSIYGLDEHSNTPRATHKNEGSKGDAIHEEDPKVHLQRVLETRKAMLQREQAMVYARALVAGFETYNLQDLVCFADAFGSPRLREACVTFMEICNRKSTDIVWMDEVAAMQAYSQSQSQYSYMGEDDHGQQLRINVQNSNFANETTTESIISHGNHHVPYHMFQPMVVPPYYQGSFPWPTNLEDSRSRPKRSHKKQSQNENFDLSDSSSGSDSDTYKRSSSRKVVIKNINYINPVKNEEPEHESDDDLSNDVANQDLDKTVDHKHEGQKVTQQWNIFQNLLMKDADEKESKEVMSPKFDNQNLISSGNQPEFATKSSTIKKHEEGDWFSRSQPDKQIHERSKDIFEDNIKFVESTKDVLVNDPLTVQSRFLNETTGSQLRTHDILMASESSNLTQKKVEGTCVNEPNDLFMVVERDTVGEQGVPAWTPEMESVNVDNKIVKVDVPEVKKSTTKGKVLEKKGSTIEAKSKALVGSRSKKQTIIPKGKSDKEEEKRKKAEELLARRQKRIAERSASTATIKKIQNPKTQITSGDVKKPVIRSSTIDRLSVARVVNPKVLPTESKTDNKPMKAAAKKNVEPKPVSKPTYPMKATTKMNVEPKPVVSRPTKTPKATTKKNVEPKPVSTKPMKVTTKKNVEPKPVSKPAKVTSREKNGVSSNLFSQRTAGTEKMKKVKLSQIKHLDKNIIGTKKRNVDLNNVKKLPKTSTIKKIGNPRAQSDNTKRVTETLHKASLVLQKDLYLSDANGGGSTNKAINSVSFKIDHEGINGAKEKGITKLNYEVVPVAEISNLPPKQESSETSNYRKKWSNVETKSKALSGFRKLLSFGRRS